MKACEREKECVDAKERKIDESQYEKYLGFQS